MHNQWLLKNVKILTFFNIFNEAPTLKLRGRTVKKKLLKSLKL